jgi:hypothetical protein
MPLVSIALKRRKMYQFGRKLEAKQENRSFGDGVAQYAEQPIALPEGTECYQHASLL